MIPLAMLSAAFLPACTEENKEAPKEPVFPESVTKYIEPSGEAVINFAANLDWKVSIPQDADLFRISDGSQDVFSVRGKAADNVTVTVKCTAESQDFENHTVDLTLEMGGKSQVIASVILPSDKRILNVTPADLNEKGDAFVPSTDEKLDWSYTGKAIEENGNINMIWDASSRKYIAYVRFDANYEWKFMPSPEGIEVAGGKVSGTFKEYAFSLDVPNLAEAKTIPFSIVATDDESSKNSFNLVVPKFVPEFAAYKVIVKNGYFEYPSDPESPFQYEFEKTPMKDIDSLELIWPDDREGFAYYILLDANFSYEVSKPEWLDITKGIEQGGKAQYSIIPNSLTFESQSGDVVFKMKGNDFSRTFSVTQPAAKNVHIDDIPALMEANKEGLIKDMNGEFSIRDKQYFVTSPGKLTIYKFIKDGDYYYLDKTQIPSTQTNADVSWLEYKDDWVKSDNVLQTYGANIAIKENTGEARSALIVGIPAHLAEEVTDPNFDLFNENGDEVSPKYAKFLVLKVDQQGVTGPSGAPVEAVDPDLWPMALTSFKSLTPDDGWEYSDVADYFTADNYYKVTYGGDVSQYPTVGEFSYIKFNRKFTDYKVYSANDKKTPVADKENFWVVVKESAYGIADEYSIQMTPSKCEGDPKDAFIVFSDGQGDFAAIYCSYDPSYDFGGGSSSVKPEFAYPEMAVEDGSILEEITSEHPLFGDWNTGDGKPLWHLKFTKENPTMSLIKGIPQGTSIPNAEWLSIEQTGDQFAVTMDKSAVQPEEWKEGKVTSSIVFYDSSWATALTLVCTLDLSAASAQ